MRKDSHPVRDGRNALTASFVTLFVAVTAVLATVPISCSQSSPAASGSSGLPPDTDTCAVPNTGCECNQPGRTVECGKVESRDGDYVSCSMGKRVCDGARWGECIGSEISTKIAGGLRFKGLGQSSACFDNPCDPYCNNYIDDVDGGIGAEGGFVSDGGLALGTYTGPTALQTTSTGLSSCGSAKNVTTPGQACVPGVPGTCKQDFRCDTTGASPVCVWNGGEGYYDKSVAGADLTIGAACDIGFGNIIPVCNRGSATVPADSEIGIYLVSSTTLPDGCAAPPSSTPDCKLKVPTGGLVAGSCINVACNVPGDMYAIVNPGSSAIISEQAGYCANNVAYANTTGGTCASCISCNTYVEGVVHDPGNNVGLSGITVFEPYTSPSVLVDNDPAVGPQCDSCTSLLDPTSFSTGVNTNNDGSFSMGRVTPGPNRWIVAQTGRWRRKLQLDIPACVTTTLTDDQIRMPRNRGEGDIPKMALVSGDQEALDCWLLKVGLDPAEVWPRGGVAPGDTLPDQARIQLYYGNGMTQQITCPATAKTLGAACGTCNAGLSCNAGANSTCLNCGGSGQACCAMGTPCTAAGTVCDDTNTCTPCGATNATCCPTGPACSGANQCDPSTNTCRACGANGQAPCTVGTPCASGTALNPSTNTCVSCGTSGAACCLTGNPCGANLLCDDTTNKCAACGGSGQKCCPGSTCTSSGRACEPASNTCQTCGTAAGRPCCAGNVCSGSGLTCSAAGVCLKNGAGSGQTTPVGACGADGEPCCKVSPSTQTTLCVTGLTCSSTSNGTCSKCGAQGQKCCAGSTCNGGLTCGIDNKCGCGGNGETCCAGNTCRSGLGLTCIAGKCGACGDLGESCCAGDVCTAPGTTCGGGGVPNVCGHCGDVGEPCCGGTTCSGTFVCGGGGAGKCGACGGHGEACCPTGPACTSAGDTCNGGVCSQLCGGLNQAPCAGGTCATSGLKVIGGTCQCYSRTVAPMGPTLWAADPITGQPPIKEYSAVILPCTGLDQTQQMTINYPANDSSDFRNITAAERTVMQQYADQGGRVFVDHLPASAGWLARSGAIPAWSGTNISTWYSYSSSPSAVPAQGFLIDAPGPQATLAAWLSLWAPYTPGPGPGWLKVGTPRKDSINPGNATTEWIRGKNNNAWGANPPVGGDYDLSFSFETPVGGAAKCGRLIYNDMHVSPNRATNNKGLFPTQCSSAPLTDEELALEYQFFQLTACQLGGSPPPPPPPPPPAAPALTASTFTRDYEALCPPGTKVTWRFFSWQASIPTGTNIVFTAQTAPAQASLAAAPSVGAGTASVTTTPAGAWFHDANTVETHLNNDIPGNRLTSERWLRISMLFNPSGAITPILYNWRQVYDCIPNE